MVRLLSRQQRSTFALASTTSPCTTSNKAATAAHPTMSKTSKVQRYVDDTFGMFATVNSRRLCGAEVHSRSEFDWYVEYLKRRVTGMKHQRNDIHNIFFL